MDRQSIGTESAQQASPKFRIERWIMLTIVALACISALASLFVKGHMGTNPMIAAAVLLSAPSLALSLYRKPPRLVTAAAAIGAALFVWVFMQWLMGLNNH